MMRDSNDRSVSSPSSRLLELFCMLPRTSCAETVGEVADFLMRHESINRELTAAAYQQSVIVCVRTETQTGDASKLLQSTIGGIGRGAGHRHRAGERIFRLIGGGIVPIDIQNDLLGRWLTACDIKRRAGKPLLTQQQINSSLEGTRLSDAFRPKT